MSLLMEDTDRNRCIVHNTGEELPATLVNQSFKMPAKTAAVSFGTLDWLPLRLWHWTTHTTSGKAAEKVCRNRIIRCIIWEGPLLITQVLVFLLAVSLGQLRTMELKKRLRH